MENKPKKTKAFIIAFIVMLALLIGGYFLFRNGGSFLTKGIAGKTFAPLLGSLKQKDVTPISGGTGTGGATTSGGAPTGANGGGTIGGGTTGGTSGTGAGGNGSGNTGGGINGGGGILGGTNPIYIPNFNPFPTPVNTTFGGNQPSVTLSASPSFLPAGGGTTKLTVATSKTTQCIPSWTNVPNSIANYTTGDLTINKTTTFTIACTDGKTTVGAYTTIVVGGIGTNVGSLQVTLTATPLNLPITGGDTTLTWTSASGATSCIRSWATGNTKANNSVGEKVTIKQTTTFTVTCTDGVNSGSGQATVIVSGPGSGNGGASPYVTLIANPTWVAYGGGTTTLSWSTYNITKPACTADWNSSITGNSDIVSVTSTKKFIITCVDGATNAKFSANTTVIAPTSNQGFYISSFTANPDYFTNGGGSTTLSWTTNGIKPVCTGDWATGTLSGNSDTTNVTKSKNLILSCTDAGTKRSASLAIVVTNWNNLTQCNDGIDNNQNGLTDGGDPSCHTDGDPANSASYDQTLDGEHMAVMPQRDSPECSDGYDNNNNKLIDAKDPICHTDFNASNPVSYNPLLKEKPSALGNSDQCIQPKLTFNDEEKKQLDDLTRQFFLLAPTLKSADDIAAEKDAAKNYQAILDQAKEFTGECYAQTNSCDEIPKKDVWGNDDFYYATKVSDCNKNKNIAYAGPTARKKNPYFPSWNDKVDTNFADSYIPGSYPPVREKKFNDRSLWIANLLINMSGELFAKYFDFNHSLANANILLAQIRDNFVLNDPQEATTLTQYTIAIAMSRDTFNQHPGRDTLALALEEVSTYCGETNQNSQYTDNSNLDPLQKALLKLYSPEQIKKMKEMRDKNCGITKFKMNDVQDIAAIYNNFKTNTSLEEHLKALRDGNRALTRHYQESNYPNFEKLFQVW